MLHHVLERAMELQAEAAGRLQKGEEEVRTRLGLLLYPTGPEAMRKRGGKQSPKRARKKS
jgi:hypothetical protein